MTIICAIKAVRLSANFRPIALCTFQSEIANFFSSVYAAIFPITKLNIFVLRNTVLTRIVRIIMFFFSELCSEISS